MVVFDEAVIALVCDDESSAGVASSDGDGASTDSDCVTVPAEARLGTTADGVRGVPTREVGLELAGKVELASAFAGVRLASA